MSWPQAIAETFAGDTVVLENFKRSIQTDEYSCGAHCAAMILRYYGMAQPFRDTLRELQTSEENGTGVEVLRRLFRQRGLRPRRINKPNLKKIREEIDKGHPVIVHMDGDHWTVVFGYGRRVIYVADPSLCRALFCRHTTHHFMRRWDRWAMVVGG